MTGSANPGMNVTPTPDFASLIVLRRATAPDDSAGNCRRPDGRQGPSDHAQAAIDLQAAILSALRKRNGGMVVGKGAPARWKLKASRSD